MKKSKSKKNMSIKKKQTIPSVEEPTLNAMPIFVAPPEKTIAEKIWEQIKNVELTMFGLPNQVVSKYCSPVFLEPSKLYLTYKVGLLLPIMEEVFKNKYIIDRSDKYITVTLYKG